MILNYIYTFCKPHMSSKGRLMAVGHEVLSIKELIDVKESCMMLDIEYETINDLIVYFSTCY